MSRGMMLHFALHWLVEHLILALFASMANKNDRPTCAEALYAPDSSGFIAAMELEILTLIELNIFDVIAREKHMKVISGVWALRCKQYPDGLISKVKIRYCTRGFEQIEGFNHF